MDYKYKEKDFLALIEEDDTVTYTSHPISIEHLATIGIEGLNEMCCDDIVEDGHLLEDISYSAKSIEGGDVVVEATAHAGTWKAEKCCPDCGALKKVVMIPDAVGKGLHESTECSESCGWTEED